MSALLTTLPGDIPGLLLRWSPVILCDEAVARAVSSVEYASDETPYVNVWGSGRLFHGAEVALDLTDRTGRAHAAWWAVERGVNDASYDESRVVFSAERGAPMTPEHIDRLARLVLRLAGRTP